MNRKFFAFMLLLATTFSLSSCLSSDDTTNVNYSHDTAITAFSLGTLDKYSLTKAGKDTLLQSAITGSNYNFYIDQTKHEIYNVDSLPKGAKVSAVLATVSSKNSGTVFLMDTVKVDSIVSYVSSSDSIDFSKPRYMRVYNGDGTAYATYKVTVNVHQEEADSFRWISLAQQNAQLAALSDLKVLSLGNMMYVFGKSNAGLKIYKTAITDGSTWDEVEPNVDFAQDDYQNAVVMDGSLYMLTDGKVYASKDAKTWTAQGSDDSLKKLVGASRKYLYAYTTTGISVSKDQGATWTSLSLDASMSYLPTANISLNTVSVRSIKNTENVVLLGTRDASYNDSIAVTWHHLVDYDSNGNDNTWNYYDLNPTQANKMMAKEEVLVCASDTGLVALGSDNKWYSSKDAGLQWMVDTTVVMPTLFNGTAARYGFCRDTNKFYWVIQNGYVWKGRHNRDGWRKE